ncbi:hypothetical protein INT43_007780 [Umbelopsis isabellina]|uniref:Uncharacterized protein n=1 Tax=Mortierella isabellina TaxID=91625 RepID=A0A8H7PPD8_MORIS|nr:hypothetical protein INT43_007780 [Umbelopsis isabellina]
MLSCEADCRRVSQQSIPSLSSVSTDSSTSLDTQRRVNRRPKPPKGLASPTGYQSHSKRHVALNMETYQPMLPFASSPFPSNPYATLPLGYYNDPSAYPIAYPTAAYEETWNKSRHYYGNQGIKVYEPIMPVPLAVTMEATMYDCVANEFDYDDNIPLAYFQSIGQASNTKQNIKGKTPAHKSAMNKARIDRVPTPTTVTKVKSPSSSSNSNTKTLGLRKNHKSATNISHATSPGHKRNSEPPSKRKDNVVESRRAANTALHHKWNLTPKETSPKVHEVVPCEPYPNTIKRFLAGINRFNTKSVKSNQ